MCLHLGSWRIHKTHLSSVILLDTLQRQFATCQNYVKKSFFNTKLDFNKLLASKIPIHGENALLTSYNDTRYPKPLTPSLRKIQLNFFGHTIDCHAGDLKTFIKHNKLVLVVNADGVTLLIQPTFPESFSLLSQEIQNLSLPPLMGVPIRVEVSSSASSDKQTRYLIRVFLSVFGYLGFIYVFHYLVLLCCHDHRREDPAPPQKPRTLSEEDLDIMAKERVLGDDLGKYDNDL